METLKKKILNVLNTNSFFVKNISFLAGDASDRKYFLAKTKKQEVIIMVDKNPDDLRQFLKITKALEKKVSVPKIYKTFQSNGLAIIENFGEFKYSNILNSKNSKKLYKLDINKFLDESNLFFDWYLPFFKINKGNVKNEFNLIFIDYLKKLYRLPQVFVHRDYHIDNLFFCKIGEEF